MGFFDNPGSDSLKAKVDEVAKLSTIPVVLSRIMAVVDDENSTREDLERAIEHDQAIAAKVVEMANAAYYGFSRKIRTISAALPILGFETVKGLAISAAVFKDITRGDNSKVMVFWSHSFEVAVTAGILAQKTGLINKEAPFIAGLLHDIGRPILYQIFGDRYLDLSNEDRTKLLINEEERFGATHALVGAWFAERCNFPEDLVKAIALHHTPEDYLTDTSGGMLSYLLPIVYLADHIVSLGADSFENDYVMSPQHQKVLEVLEVDEAMILKVKEELEEQKPQISEYYV